LLVLDEPTTGVDAVSRAEFWTMLGKLRKYNITIIVSTPYMDEAMKCDRVALIQNGEILSVDQPDNIIKGFSGKLYSVKATEKYKLINALRQFPQTVTAWPFGDSVHVTFKDDRIDESFIAYLNDQGLQNVTICESIPGIEDRFLELMKKDVNYGR
jgi:ABC-type multidrug transport system ATPase subunit